MSSSSFVRRAIPLTGLAFVCLVAVAAAPASPSVVPAAAKQVALPSFACYEAKFSPMSSPTVRIVDRFSKRSTTLLAAVSFCAPAVAKGAPVGASVHLACHSVAERALTPIIVTASNTLGELTATLVAAQTLCTPAAVTTGGALTAPPTALDDFTCYEVRPRPPSARAMAVADRFGRSQDVLGRVVSVCSPASVDGSRLHQRALLVCYELISEARARPAIVRSRFALLKASPGLRRQLCVPSSRL